MDRSPELIQYCAVCMVRLTDATGYAVLRPLIATEQLTTIPLAQQRFTMCSKHAADALEAKTHVAASYGRV